MNNQVEMQEVTFFMKIKLLGNVHRNSRYVTVETASPTLNLSLRGIIFLSLRGAGFKIASHF